MYKNMAKKVTQILPLRVPIVTTQNIHKVVFATLGCKFNPSEKVSMSEKSISFNLFSIGRLHTLLGEADLVRVHKTGDVTLCAPWGILKEEIEGIEEGTYAVIIAEKKESFKIFVPCGGPDVDTDEVPSWVNSVRIDEICRLKVKKLPAYQSIGMASKIKKGDDSFVTLKDKIVEKDYLLFNKEQVRVKAVAVDFNTDLNNSIRIEGEFLYSHLPQNFKICRMPQLQGKILVVKNDKLKLYRPITVELDSINKHGFGNACFRYHYFCFNEMGFLIHDTAHHYTDNEV